ncbi:zinc-binding dehydrogenase [Streptomyces varsoviensis]|uniref:zinc-binding dehydrogenase n=1 Tax=Streptomyces varsoviensis TaxID=67373 RepID=UPI00340011C0
MALLTRLTRKDLRGLFSFVRRQDLLALKSLAERGYLTPAVDSTHPLAEAPAAIRRLKEGHPQGKVVLTVTPDAQAADHEPVGERREARYPGPYYCGLRPPSGRPTGHGRHAHPRLRGHRSRLRRRSRARCRRAKAAPALAHLQGAPTPRPL